MIKRTRTITRIEQHSRTVIRVEGGNKVWCDHCGRNIWATGIDDASALCGVSVRVLWGFVESGAIHCFEPPDGRLLICLPSLKVRLQPEQLNGRAISHKS